MRQGFASWRNYRRFSQEIARNSRHFWSPETHQFLDALSVGSRARVGELAAGKLFYRAQVAHAYDSDGVPSPALPERMTPYTDRAKEGRVNPKGIPCLYMAGDMHTAIAECRPWIGSLVSVGTFKIARALRIVDCTSDRERPPSYFSVLTKDYEPSAEKIEEAVWAHVAHAFREPVTRDDDLADYAPTQVIAELFRREEFDGVGYRSAFGTDRFNVALFDVKAARLHGCSLHEIRGVQLDWKETANPYQAQDPEGFDPAAGEAFKGPQSV
jgi:RES domain